MPLEGNSHYRLMVHKSSFIRFIKLVGLGGFFALALTSRVSNTQVNALSEPSSRPANYPCFAATPIKPRPGTSGPNAASAIRFGSLIRNTIAAELESKNYAAGSTENANLILNVNAIFSAKNEFSTGGKFDANVLNSDLSNWSQNSYVYT